MDSAVRHVLELSRRGALRGATGLAALAALAPRPLRAQAPGPLFTLGVASGDPWPDSVVLWTRLAPAPLEAGGGMGNDAVPVAWEVAEDDGFRRVVARGEALARPESAHAVHVEAGGLRPGRGYFYRFTAQGQQSRVGRTRTAPAPGEAAALNFLAAGCQHYEHGHFTAWHHAAREEDVAFVFHYGDYIYEYAGRRPGQGGWGPVVRSHHGPATVTLDQYRSRHAQYRTDPDLADAQAAHPFITTYDDHEVENNWVTLQSQRDGTGRFRDVVVTPEEFALRAAAAFQAWYEHTPVRPSARPRAEQITAFRRLRFGALLDFHALDTRRFRDDQPCGDGTRIPCAAVARPDAQVLGPAQEEWLRAGLRAGRATWQVLGQQIFFAPRVFPGGPVSMDSWDGYPAARARVLDMLEGRNAVVLTGDVHRAWAGDIQRTPEGPALGVEFVTTSVSSEGDGSEAQPTAEGVLRNNPHLRFHSNRRGYTRHEVRADRLSAIYRAVPYVERPGAPREDRAHLVTLAGRPGVVPG
ncbi:MAG TPA: alkaline phosphatase D family protein [Roseococcus sp.]|nr:alkaline phosphatase D family protein [Roseococcus sp.]